MPRLNDIVRLGDRFGEYQLVITCSRCKHIRRSDPHVFARIMGWSTRLEVLSERLRYSNCGVKGPTIHCETEPRPRGVPKNPH